VYKLLSCSFCICYNKHDNFNFAMDQFVATAICAFYNKNWLWMNGNCFMAYISSKSKCWLYLCLSRKNTQSSVSSKSISNQFSSTILLTKDRKLSTTAALWKSKIISKHFTIKHQNTKSINYYLTGKWRFLYLQAILRVSSWPSAAQQGTELALCWQLTLVSMPMSAGWLLVWSTILPLSQAS